MDAGPERGGRGGNRDMNRSWSRPDHRHKRARRDNENQSRYGPAQPEVVVPTLADEKETDEHRLAQRQKQIDYGKNTIGYDRYCAMVPRHQRRPGKHPMTPDKTKKVGKKVFDGFVRKWRQALHKYDPPELTEAVKTVAAEASTAAETTGSNATSSDTAAIPSASVETTSSSAAATTSLADNKTSSPGNATPPSRSIYENFDEDNFDDKDSDDDLL